MNWAIMSSFWGIPFPIFNGKELNLELSSLAKWKLILWSLFMSPISNMHMYACPYSYLNLKVMEKYIGNETPLYSISRKVSFLHISTSYNESMQSSIKCLLTIYKLHWVIYFLFLIDSLSQGFFHGCTFDTSLEVGDVGFFASEK